jgi:four helix bundle protein
MARSPRYHSLVAWQRADDLVVRLHQVAREHFPADERNALSSQMRRAALSVPANIVEGTARHHPRETLQFLRTAWASLVEVGYCLHAARRLGYIPDALHAELDLDLRRAAAPLLGMIRRRQEPAGLSARPPSRRRRAPPRRA